MVDLLESAFMIICIVTAVVFLLNANKRFINLLAKPIEKKMIAAGDTEGDVSDRAKTKVIFYTRVITFILAVIIGLVVEALK